MRRPIHRRPLAVLAPLALALAFAPGARGDASARDEALLSFQRFARGWLAELQGGGPNRMRFGDVELEVRATGDRAVPYVGVLRYTEESLKCPPEAERICQVLRRSPITEVFPFRGGRWRQ